MEIIKVLFVCVHNSARSQMAEAFANFYGEGLIAAESAGLEPGQLNPRVVAVLKEVGIDISENTTKSVFDLFKQGRMFSYVIAVCDQEAAETCPVFAGVTTRWHGSFPDPSSLTGTEEEQLQRTREIRHKIRSQIIRWLAEILSRAGCSTR